jgi:extracellular elastinolytic metalloproteinase
MNVWALEAHQSGGMGEGWSDYFPCTVNNSITVGDWVANRPNGIRGFPYDSDFPDNFGDLGTGRYSGYAADGRRWPHPIGEIWCVTLLEMNRNIGTELGAQLVVDGLKLTPANPSFLDSRDAILEALDHMLASGQLNRDDYDEALQGVWQAFVRFGMGPDAQSNGASLSGIVADFNMPEFEQPDPADIHLEARPNLAIPDNQAEGVSSILSVTQSGHIGRLKLSIDIQHTYIGDLHVSLISPSGSTVILHDRSGAGADDLVKTYDSDDLIDLEAILGESVQGDWILRVADLAGLDHGTLRGWELAIYLESEGNAVHGEAEAMIPIPDQDPAGISSMINIAPSGTVQSLAISVDITHTYIGDLRVILETPSGLQALLHDQFGGSNDNLIRSYDSNSHPELAALIGDSIQGDWVLRVADLVGQDVGKLNRWRLDLAV